MCAQRPTCKYHLPAKDKGNGCGRSVDMYEECLREKYVHYREPDEDNE